MITRVGIGIVILIAVHFDNLYDDLSIKLDILIELLKKMGY